ncbi:MAG: SDR family oxidoreductase [Chlamydiae bacterium]|nr:SDR family oxidoreductase [Chlamydiota bacterium]
MLKNQHVVIIGGSSGMGLATAKHAIVNGAKVTIIGRDKAKLERAQNELVNNVHIYHMDASKEEELIEFFDKVEPIDQLAILGLGTSSGSCVSMKTDLARQSFDNKFWGQYLAVKHGAHKIKKSGSIVLMSGVLGKRPRENTAVMSSVNGAVEGLCRALAIELSPIRVNVVSPGYVDTPLFSGMTAQAKEELFNQWKKMNPLKKVGSSEEIASAVIYLMTNTYTTGSTLCVDGGYTMH